MPVTPGCNDDGFAALPHRRPVALPCRRGCRGRVARLVRERLRRRRAAALARPGSVAVRTLRRGCRAARPQGPVRPDRPGSQSQSTPLVRRAGPAGGRRGKDRPRRPRLPLVRAALLPFAVVAVLWFLVRCRTLKRGWLCALLAFLGFANGLAAWTVRNFQTFHDAVPIADSTYLHLWIGNNPLATGGPQD